MTKRCLYGFLAVLALSALVWRMCGERAHPRQGGETTPPAAPVGLPAGWSLTRELPGYAEPDSGGTTPAERLVLRVEDGWLVVRLETAGGELQWHIVLARATDPRPPTVATDEYHGLSVAYGPYCVREHVGRLRVHREAKSPDSPEWPMPSPPPGEETRFSTALMKLSRAGDWFWLSSGAARTPPDVRIRFQHARLLDSGHGVQTFHGGPSYAFCGDEAKCFDEGDLLHGRRMPPYEAEAILRRRKLKAEFGSKPAPSLVGTEWLNTPSPLALASLKGKVVLLDFWGKWCGPCVAKLPKAQALHDEYADRGLVVIGVHSAHHSDGLAEFLKEKHVTFPVVIDTGETARKYLVEGWPTYFLIDRSGKVVSGFTHTPFTAERIEPLLKE